MIQTILSSVPPRKMFLHKMEGEAPSEPHIRIRLKLGSAFTEAPTERRPPTQLICRKVFSIGINLAIATATAVCGAEYLSPMDMQLIDGRRTLLITQDTGKRLDFFDTTDSRVVRSIALPDRPRGLVCSADGRTAYVLTGEGEGALNLLDLSSGKMLRQIPVGHGPMAPVLSPDGQTLYVCNRFDNSIGFVDLEKQRQTRTVPVVREPVASALTPDGQLLFVANHLPDGPANVDYVAAKISVIDTVKGEVVKNIRLVNGAEGLRGMCMSADGQFVYATHLMARYQVPATQLDRGWVSTDALGIIRVADLKLLHTVLLDDVDRGFANPWGVAISPDGKLLCVASAGNNELSLIDLPALTAKTATTVNPHNDLSMLVGVRQRIPLQGVGTRAVLMHNDRIYITEYFSDSLGIATLQEGAVKSVQSIPLGPELPLTPERRGEILFNDARMCYQNWLSCASCHPDARTDALNWDLLNDGIGNPKNVKSMLLAHRTPPTTWMGERADAETSVRAGIRHIQFVVRPETDARAIDAYLRSLEQTPSPFLVDGKLSKSAKRGGKIFEQAGCSQCHPAPLFTNLNQYDVGTGTGLDAGKAFDVPSLREIWRTAPYLHDGSASTIRDILQGRTHAEIIEKTDGMSDRQLQNIEEYLLSL